VLRSVSECLQACDVARAKVPAKSHAITCSNKSRFTE
jgi:hypothetical protein